MTIGLTRLSAAAAVVMLFFVAMAPPASAHGDDETTEGYLLVQQALGHLAHDTSAEGIDLAMEKVQDALDTKDQKGVSVSELEKGMSALKAGDASQARVLLQDSITDALANQPRATANQTGTTTIVPELEGRTGFSGLDWLLLLLSIVTVIIGGSLAYLFRPHDSIGVLRSLLGGGPEQSSASVPGDRNGS